MQSSILTSAKYFKLHQSAQNYDAVTVLFDFQTMFCINLHFIVYSQDLIEITLISLKARKTNVELSVKIFVRAFKSKPMHFSSSYIINIKL